MRKIDDVVHHSEAGPLEPRDDGLRQSNEQDDIPAGG